MQRRAADRREGRRCRAAKGDDRQYERRREPEAPQHDQVERGRRAHHEVERHGDGAHEVACGLGRGEDADEVDGVKREDGEDREREARACARAMDVGRRSGSEGRERRFHGASWGRAANVGFPW